MLYWLLGTAGTVILLLLGIIGYFYQRNQTINDGEVEYMSDKYNEINEAVIQGFSDLKNIVTKLEAKFSVEEVKHGGFQETCAKLTKSHERKFDLLDRKVDQAIDKVAEHELKIKLLELKRNGPGK